MSFFEELKRRNVVRVGIAYTVATWLLIQVTDTVFPRIGLPDSAVTLVIALLFLGFIPALIFAWAFEMTPDGIKREKEIDRTQSITPKTGRKLDRVIILVLAVVVVWFLIDKYYFKPGSDVVATESVSVAVDPTTETTSTNSPQSIAVLPFVNMSSDVDNEYFSDGISEELLNVLVKVSTLHVASRTSAFAYKGKDLPISQIASELKVDNILEGSVRKAGNRVRITAQLIDAKTDRHLWSETYERELVDIFDIQEEISNNIVAALKIALNVDETAALDRAQHPTKNTEAYELYLQGRFAWRQRHEENILKSIELFEKAIAIDPTFARAHEALAVAWSVLPSWSATNATEASQKARPHALRALELDPKLSEARAVMAEISLGNYQWADGMAQYRQALKDEPRNPTLQQWFAEAFVTLGFLTQGLEHIQKAYELDPASPVVNQSMVWIASLNQEDDLAFKHVEISNGLGMGNRALFVSTNSVVRRHGWQTFLDSLETIGEVPAMTRACILAQDSPSIRDTLPAQLDEWIENSPDRLIPARVIYCMVLSGQTDRAAEFGRLRVEDEWFELRMFWQSNAEAGALRQTRIFKDLLRDMGLVEFYREYGWPDLCRPIGEDDFECDP